MDPSFIKIINPGAFHSPIAAIVKLKDGAVRPVIRKSYSTNNKQDSVTTPKPKRAVSQIEEAEYLAAGRKPIHLLFEFCGLAVFMGWMAILGNEIYERVANDNIGLRMIYPTVIAGLLGIATSDFTSGAIHWAVDNWGDSEFPILGSLFFRPFHHHHADPRAITTHGFIETNGNNFFASLPLLWAATSTIRLPDITLSLTLTSFWISYALCSGFANQIHSWAHMKNPPNLVRIMQDYGLLVGRRHHQIHHIRPHDRNYCLITGWMNRPLTAIHFFETIEYVITSLTGALPLHARIETN